MAFSGRALAQENSTPTFRAETSVVLVPTLVTTPQGRVVFGLQAKDFVLLDNGAEQKVQVDETFASKPVSIVIAVQRGGRAPQVLGGGCLPPEKENVFTRKAGKCVSPMHGIAQMLETFLNDPGSEMALVSFDSQVRLRRSFTPAVDEITKELEALPAGDNGSAILDSIQYSLNLLKQRPDDHRRVLVVVSEKIDRGSTHTTLNEAVRQIASSSTEIYMITMEDVDSAKGTLRMIARLLGPSLMTMGRGMPPGGGPPGGGGGGMGQGIGPLTGSASSGPGKGNEGIQSGSDPTGKSTSEDGYSSPAGGTPGMLRMQLGLSGKGEQGDIPQTIANLTGGEYVLFSDSRGLDDALGLLNNHAHNRYLLSFQVKNTEPGLHRISVFMREPMAVRVAARTSYWQRAQADHSAAAQE